jgi:amino acid transporter
MEKRTPVLALFFGGIIAILLIIIFENPARPFAMWQGLLLFALCYLPGMGIAMLFDPHAKRAKEEYLKINFYEEKK